MNGSFIFVNTPGGFQPWMEVNAVMFTEEGNIQEKMLES